MTYLSRQKFIYQRRRRKKSQKYFFSGNKKGEEPNFLCSSGVEDDQTFGSFLVHDPVSAFPASDRVSGPDLVLGVALAADVDHRVTDGAGSVGRRAGLRIHDRRKIFST